MSKAKRRRPNQPPKSPKPSPEPRSPWWKQHWKFLATVAGLIVATVGFASALATFLPRVQFDVSSEYISGSPFPASVTVINQLWPLSGVSFVVRICSAQNAGGGKIIGMKKCTGGSNGGANFTTPDWQKHQLRSDEKWVVYVGGNIQFNVDATSADVRMVIRYWPWLLPHPWFMQLREKEARVVLYTKPDGSHFWGAKPVD